MVFAASTGSVKEAETQAFIKRFQLPGFESWPPEFKELSLSYRGANPEGVARWCAIEAHSQQPGALPQPLRSPNTYAKLDKIRTPTLVMAAGADFYAPPGLMRLLATHIKNSEWVIVPDAGHSIAWEQPEMFNQYAFTFINKHR